MEPGADISTTEFTQAEHAAVYKYIHGGNLSAILGKMPGRPTPTLGFCRVRDTVVFGRVGCCTSFKPLNSVLNIVLRVFLRSWHRF
ncbi:hypothetical protein BQ8482_290117 [Mesorhizobium delmotii]|uniref:Uncharacterized protein n=1 Tax=Mesorhizobium delmotii TaxID=1631247 RepID=A0A2P9AN16_9HYPH|nr:hypothetical protein BQ8482_290117 [Mesorhizobium delmotii]